MECVEVFIGPCVLVVPECDFFTLTAICEFQEEFQEEFLRSGKKISGLFVITDYTDYPDGFFVGFLNGHMLEFYNGGNGRIIAKGSVAKEEIFEFAGEAEKWGPNTKNAQLLFG